MRFPRSIVVVLALALSLVGLVVLPAHAAPGDLDPSFGTGGKVTTDIAGGNDAAFAMVIQPDGKLVAAGRFSIPGAVAAGWALARYNPDASLDTSFGSGGKVTTTFTRDGSEAFAVVLQPDGKLVAAGTTPSGTRAGNDFALARYNLDGSLDTSFGSAGKVATEFGAGTGFADARALVLQPDGKLVAADTVFVNDGTSNNFALARYNSDGSLDTSFGSGGKVIKTSGAAPLTRLSPSSSSPTGSWWRPGGNDGDETEGQPRKIRMPAAQWPYVTEPRGMSSENAGTYSCS